MNGYDKYTRYLEHTNGDPWKIAAHKVSKQRYAAKRRDIDWNLNDEKTIKKAVEGIEREDSSMSSDSVLETSCMIEEDEEDE